MLGLSARSLAAAAAYSAAIVGAGFVAATSAQDEQGSRTYRRFRQAPFAPPAAAFGPAWTVNKIGSSWSAVRLVHVDADDAAARKAGQVALGAALVNELTYVGFPFAYFKLRSPWLAAAVTTTSAVATLVQLDATRRVDTAAAIALLPETAWLALATPVAVYQALYNEDPLLHTEPLVHP